MFYVAKLKAGKNPVIVARPTLPEKN
jgi:hypothetical protein